MSTSMTSVNERGVSFLPEIAARQAEVGCFVSAVKDFVRVVEFRPFKSSSAPVGRAVVILARVRNASWAARDKSCHGEVEKEKEKPEKNAKNKARKMQPFRPTS